MSTVQTMLKNVKAVCMPITNMDAFIRRALNEGQYVISRRAPKGGWFFMRRYKWPLSVVSGTAEYALSNLVDTSKLINFWDETDDVYISPMSETTFRMTTPDPTSDTGTSYLYRLKGYSPVQYQPSSASVLTFVSSNAADATDIMVQGTSSTGLFLKETVTINGTTNVTTTNSYLKVFGLEKDDVSAGQITVTSNSGGVTNVVIPANFKFISHPVIEFYNAPDASKTLYYDFTMRPQDIYNDGDSSLIDSKYHDVIETWAIHKTFGVLQDDVKKATALQEFELGIKSMQDENYQPQGITTFSDFSFAQTTVGARFQGRFPR